MIKALRPLHQNCRCHGSSYEESTDSDENEGRMRRLSQVALLEGRSLLLVLGRTIDMVELDVVNQQKDVDINGLHEA